MIIGIDSSKAAIEKRTGVENYVYQLILHLPKIDTKNTYYFYTNQKLPAETLASKNVIEKLFKIKRLWNKFFLPLYLIKEKTEIYIQPLDMVPKTACKNSIAIVHDLASYKFPDAYSGSERKLQDATLKNIAVNAKKIVCVSNSTKNDLIKYFPSIKDKITVIYPSYNEEIYHPIKGQKDVLNLKTKYFLFVGRLEERKNVTRIVKAFKIFKEKTNLPHKLVLAGKAGFGFETIRDLINQLPAKIKNDIVMSGYIKNEDILDLYAGAEAFIYPSLYEGFGIAVLDAMAAGTPVITANTSSLPEAAGDAAILVNPQNEKEIAKALETISTDKHTREEVIQKGYEHIKKFSWDKTAADFVKLMEEM
jgi:glycosyltransferase involved in cell wall biosynthesis